MSTAIIVPGHPLAGVVDRDVKSLYEGHAMLNIGFSTGHVQHQITFLFGSNLRTINIDDEIVVFDQMVDDRLLTFTSWKEQH
jgi:hypothetical protein